MPREHYSSDVREENASRRIAVVGAGHVGLTTAVCFAARGYDVRLYDNNREKVEMIQKGIPPFYEPDLDSLLTGASSSGSLSVSSDVKSCISHAQAIFVAVGTPAKSDGSIDLSWIKSCCIEIGRALRDEKGYSVVCVRSTVVPGTTERVIRPILERYSLKKVGRDFGLVMQPEFLREGMAVNDTLNPSRVVMGEHDRRSGDILEKLYLEYYKGKLPPIIRTNPASAEIVKYASNAFLAMKVSFINFIAGVCETLPGVDVTDVARAVGLDDRIGAKFLNAGAGFGGSCFGKDLNALIKFSEETGSAPILIRTVLEINARQALHIVQLAARQLGNLSKKRVSVLGLAFKPNTDDMRDAPSIRVIDELVKRGASVVVHDPAATRIAHSIYRNKIQYASSFVECLSGSDCAILLTEWDIYKQLKPEDFLNSMRSPVLIDARRIYDPNEFGGLVRYSAVGLGPSRRS